MMIIMMIMVNIETKAHDCTNLQFSQCKEAIWSDNKITSVVGCIAPASPPHARD